MRQEFIEGLKSLAYQDPRIILLTADLGFGAIEPFREAHPKRCVNVGVAEQAMIGIATGLAEAGYIPYCYSIASFAVARGFEFIRNGPVAHELPVRIVGVGPGMDYGLDGLTHYAVEDLALILTQPTATTIAPKDANSARVHGSLGHPKRGLVYYRLARSGPQVLLGGVESLEYCGCLVAGFGNSVGVALSIKNELALLTSERIQCISVEHLDHHEVKILANRIKEFGIATVVTTEEHYLRGGFGTALTDALNEIGWNGRVFKWGIETIPLGHLGSMEYMRQRFCPPIEDFSEEVASHLRREQRP